MKTSIATVFAALMLASSLLAGTFSSSTTAPAVRATDIANLGTQTGSDKWIFQTADEADPSDAAKGQTFITGSTTLQLKALTYKISAGNMKAAPTTYRLRVGTVSGTTFTQIATGTFSQAANTATGAYMTWTLTTPVTLSPSTTYGIDGVSNDDERVWALNPTSGVSVSPAKSMASLKAGTFTYTRRPPSLSGRTYTVWTSPNLTTWTLDAGAIQAPAAPVGGVETVTVTLSPALLTNPKLFVRLQAAP